MLNNSKSKLEVLVSFIFLISLLSMRPTWLGEAYSTLSLLVTWSAAIILYLYSQGNSQLGIYAKGNVKILLFMGLFEFFKLINYLVRGDNNLLIVRDTILNFLILIPSFYILSFKEINKKIGLFLYLSILLLGVSTVISFLIACFIPADSLKLLVIQNQKTYIGVSSGILFPFTTILNAQGGAGERFLGISFYRTLNWFREPGIAQAFLAWAFVVTSKYFETYVLRTVIRLFLLFAALLTFSTTSIYIIPIGVVYALFFDIPPQHFKDQYKINISTKFRERNNKTYIFKNMLQVIYILILLSVLLSLFLNIDIYQETSSKINQILSSSNNLNLESKVKYAEVSFNDRRDQMLFAIQSFNENPFGFGKSDGKEINLIASLDAIGLQGLVSILAVYVHYIKKGKSLENSIFYLFSIAPIFVTALLTQPIIISPLVLVILMLFF